MSQSGFFSPDQSPLIFIICRYQVAILSLALTNIFLDKTTAFKNEEPAPKLFLNSFFILLNQSLYFRMALSYSAYAIPTLSSTFLVLAGECVTLHCDSRHLLQQLKCERRSPRLVPPYQAFSYTLRCHVN